MAESATFLPKSKLSFSSGNAARLHLPISLAVKHGHMTDVQPVECEKMCCVPTLGWSLKPPIYAPLYSHSGLADQNGDNHGILEAMC